MSSTDDVRQEFTDAERELLLSIACRSIRCGLDTGQPPAIDIDSYPGRLSARRASFVTLHAGEKLRGCIGTLEPRVSLVEDINLNAYAAAFRDTRFTPLRVDELATLTLHISVLGTPVIIESDSESSLLAKLRPGIDGLILQEHDFRSTFLPSVWESLPEPEKFLGQLKLKAGLAADYWSSTVRIWRYTTESFSASVPDISETGRDYRVEVLK